MLRFEGIKEFNPDQGKFRECAIIFSDDELPENTCKSVEEALNRYFSSRKNENIVIQIRYHDPITEIIEIVKRPREDLTGTDEQILRWLKKHQRIFEDYYHEIKPY